MRAAASLYAVSGDTPCVDRGARSANRFQIDVRTGGFEHGDDGGATNGETLPPVSVLRSMILSF